MRILGLVLVVGVVACGAPEAEPHPRVVVGFLDRGWPGPSGQGAAGVGMLTADASGTLCEAVLDRTVTDAAGRFRLVIPATAAASWASWHLCVVLDSTPPRLVVPMDVFYSGARLDSLQLYCRGHGPSGSPECRAVPWGEPMHWPGGEGYDSVPGPA